MSAMITASVIGAASVVAGSRSAGKANDKQVAANDRNLEFQKEQQEFEREKYNRWIGIYGDIEENVGQFFESLDPKVIEAQGLQSQQKNFQGALSRVRERFAQTGISSAAQAAIESSAEFDNARAKSRIRLEAPAKVAEAQQGFVQGSRGAPSGGGALSVNTNVGGGDTANAQGFNTLANTALNVAGNRLADRLQTKPLAPSTLSPFARSNAFRGDFEP